MRETLSIHKEEISKEKVDTTVQEFEKQFSCSEKPLAQAAIFADQLMEERDVADIAVASGGPTWTPTGAIQDATDGDTDFYGSL